LELVSAGRRVRRHAFIPVHGFAREARGRGGLKPNAAVVPGDVGTRDDVDALTRTLHEEPDAIVREHAAWALARLRRWGGSRGR
jgi:HEAT repeat protein